MGLCREELIELAGALGKADVCNRMLDTLERELEALYQAGQADAFILYVYGLVLADRCAPLAIRIHAGGSCTLPPRRRAGALCRVDGSSHRCYGE